MFLQQAHKINRVPVGNASTYIPDVVPAAAEGASNVDADDGVGDVYIEGYVSM